MHYELSQKFYFEAAHTLDREIGKEGSKRIHGHTYHASVTVAGAPDPSAHMIVDLGYLQEKIAHVREKLDHRFLDEVPDLGPATLENLCKYIMTELRRSLDTIVRVTIERPASGDQCTLTLA